MWNPKLYQTVFASPQLELWELDDTQWRKIVERPMGLRRTRAAARTDAQLAFAFATRERADDVA